MNLSYKVYDAMTTSPVVISKDATIQDAAKMMAENLVASLVIKEGEKFIGILTEKDITRKIALKNLDTTKTKVKDAMSVNVHTILPKDEMRDAVKKIAKSGQTQLPVVENGILLGLLTFKDIMRVQPELFGLIYETYNIKEASRKPLFSPKQNEGTCSVCGEFSINLVKTDDSEELCPHCKEIL